MFQCLIGRIVTDVKALFNMQNLPLFQCLIGRIVTSDISSCLRCLPGMFQCLIGRIVTPVAAVEAAMKAEFQCLIGRIVTAVFLPRPYHCAKVSMPDRKNSNYEIHCRVTHRLQVSMPDRKNSNGHLQSPPVSVLAQFQCLIGRIVTKKILP